LPVSAPVMICPAMHTEMWEHPAVVDNIATLRSRGVHVVEPESGRLAGGDSGQGRLASPEAIVAAVDRLFAPADMAGLKVVVSAGGTREPIDAVRVIANRSSGKQGYAIAEEAARRGAQVTLVSTVDRPVPFGVEVVRVETAAQMQAVLERIAPACDVVVMAAAVADFRPVDPADHKLKKHDGPPQIVLEPTPDIVAGLGANKPPGQTLVGFAAETDDLGANAVSKLERKRLDLIVANDVGAASTGFQHDTNAVTLFAVGEPAITLPLADKRTIAAGVLDRIVAMRASAG
jgi:phosphopantothenoylcysteine decarboxylase/phosphopantothenate--cysteine ligase